MTQTTGDSARDYLRNIDRMDSKDVAPRRIVLVKKAGRKPTRAKIDREIKEFKKQWRGKINYPPILIVEP